MLLVLALFSVCIPYIWTFPFILTGLVGFNLNYIKSDSVITEVSKATNFASYYKDSTPRGLLVGKYFVGFVFEKENGNGGGTHTEAYVLCTKKTLSQFTIDTTVGDGKYVCATIGNVAWDLKMSYTRVSPGGFPRPWQAELIGQTIDYFEQNGYCSILLSGDSGVGKSEFAGLLAEFMGVTRVSNYRPTFPFALTEVVNMTETNNDVLVISIEEFDSLLDGESPPVNKFCLPDVIGKSTWNTLMDTIRQKTYSKKLLVVATTNKPLADFADQSMINGNRFAIRKEIRL